MPRFALAVLLALPALARPVPTVYGLGESPCADYLQAQRRDQGQELRFVSWLAGYLTARLAERGDETDPSGAEAWISRYCENHPDHPFQQAAAEFLAATRDWQARH